MVGRSVASRRSAQLELDVDLPVLILRTRRYPLHHGTLGAARSLGRAGVEVHALLETRANPTAWSRHLHRGQPWCVESDAPGKLLAHLRSVARDIGRRAMLVTVDDASALFAAAHAPLLQDDFVLPAPPPDLPRRVADKAELTDLCRRHDIAHPPSRVAGDLREIDEAIDRLGLPLIAKWARPWQLPVGCPSTLVVGDRSQALRLGGENGTAALTLAGPVVLQRIVGGDGDDWFYQGYFDESSTCLFGGAGRKLLARPAKNGHTVVGQWVANPELEEHACALVKQLGYRGVVDLDFRYDRDTRTYHLVDFNPRLGAQFRLFHDLQGLDIARVQHLHLSGRPVPPIRPAYGRTLLVENHYLQNAVVRPVRCATLPGRLRQADELAWLAADDLMPLLPLAWQNIVAATSKLGRRVRRPR